MANWLQPNATEAPPNKSARRPLRQVTPLLKFEAAAVLSGGAALSCPLTEDPSAAWSRADIVILQVRLSLRPVFRQPHARVQPEWCPITPLRAPQGTTGTQTAPTFTATAHQPPFSPSPF